MQRAESMQGGAEHIAAREEGLTEIQQQSLHHIDTQLALEKRPDGTDRWWRFFDAGVRDEHGAVWALYNDFHSQESPEGWKVFYCPARDGEFHYIEVSRVLHTTIPCTADYEGARTVQLDVGGEANQSLGMVQNDILNILFRGDDPPIVKFWSDKTSMTPAIIERREERDFTRPIIEMGACALEVDRPAA